MLTTPTLNRRAPASSRVLIARFVHDWIAPRWREITAALLLTVLLAACTGLYPVIIKLSFDALNGGANARQQLPWVLSVIVLVTIARAGLMYAQNIATNQDRKSTRLNSSHRH